MATSRNPTDPAQASAEMVATHATERVPADLFLALEGPIGVGKTTLARLVHSAWHMQLLLEHFDDNPFLPLFYTDRQRYAWPTQVHFLIDRFDQWTDLPSIQSPLVSDYLFDKDRVFAELNLDAMALRRYMKVFRALRSQVRHPTGVIFLQADIEVLLARVAARARPYEQQLDRNYLSELAAAYERFFATYTAAPVLRLDLTERDVLHNAGDRIVVLQAIQSSFALPPWAEDTLLHG